LLLFAAEGVEVAAAPVAPITLLLVLTLADDARGVEANRVRVLFGSTGGAPGEAFVALAVPAAFPPGVVPFPTLSPAFLPVDGRLFVPPNPNPGETPVGGRWDIGVLLAAAAVAGRTVLLCNDYLMVKRGKTVEYIV
jgi:hypothetical protein